MLKIEHLIDPAMNGAKTSVTVPWSSVPLWIPARPVNYQLRTLGCRLSDAWAVFTGRAEAVTWPDDKPKKLRE